MNKQLEQMLRGLARYLGKPETWFIPRSVLQRRAVRSEAAKRGWVKRKAGAP